MSDDQKPIIPKGLVARLFLRVRVFSQQLPEDLAKKDVDICYVLEQTSGVYRRILKQVCHDLDLPDPTENMSDPEAGYTLPRLVSLRQPRSYLVDANRHDRCPNSLQRLVQHARDTNRELLILPVSILLGRAPERNVRWYKMLFSENWALGSPFRRFFSIIFHGHDTQLEFGQGIALSELKADESTCGRTVLKITRLCRRKLRQIREAAIGPDLSHKRTMIAGVLSSRQVQAAIKSHSEKKNLPYKKAYREAEKYALEIASDYSYIVVRLGYRFLSWLWNRIYDGIEVRHIDRLKSQAPGCNLVYVPCHRSHMDYLLLSYILHDNGLVPPHIAAGVNLNLPFIGPILRRGGAFFLRRSFRNNRLYSAVFHQYVSSLFARGVAMEYFIEGTRSRTGRLLPPKPGMISMTLRSYLQNPTRPLLFQPVYIGYERMPDGNSYISELLGAKKKSENLFGLLRSLNILRQQFGRVHVGFAKPIAVDKILNRHEPTWREKSAEAEEKPAWFSDTVNELSENIMQAINRNAHLSSINLLASLLLATPKSAMDKNMMLRVLHQSLELTRELPLPEGATVTSKSPEEIISKTLQLEFINLRENSLGDILETDERQAALLSYFRNNSLHLFVLPASIACCFRYRRSCSRKRIFWLAEKTYPYIRAELFLSMETDEFMQRLDETLAVFVRQGYLVENEEGDFQRDEGGSFMASFLSLISHGLTQVHERYYLTLSVLHKYGSGHLTTGELESLCQETAHKIALLEEFTTPEFFDKTLFRNFIAALKDNDVLATDSEGKLSYVDALEEIIQEGRMVLGPDLRHGIAQAIPE